MRISATPTLALVLLILGAPPISAQLKKVRFSTTEISISELPFKVAHVKGFYREEGLDVETILIRGAVGMQALLGGSITLRLPARLSPLPCAVCRSSSCSFLHPNRSLN